MIIDNTQLTRFQECPRLYQYQIIEGLKFPGYPEGPFSVHLVHRPLADLYRAVGGGGDIANFRPDWLKYWEKYLVDVPEPPGYLELDVAQRIYQRYVQQFGDDFQLYDILEVETKLEIPQIAGFVVKPDLVLREKETGLVFPMDHKVSKWEKPLIVYDRQFLAQVVGVMNKYHYDTWDFRFVRNFFQLGKDNWTREEVFVPKDLIQEWLMETAADADEMRRAAESGIFSKRSQSCHRGKWECPAKKLCEAGSLRREVMKSMERVENPLAYLEE